MSLWLSALHATPARHAAAARGASSLLRVHHPHPHPHPHSHSHSLFRPHPRPHPHPHFLSRFSTSAAARTRARPTQTIARPKRTHDVVPPTPGGALHSSAPSAASPSVSRITPITKHTQPQRGDRHGHLSHEQPHRHQSPPGSNHWPAPPRRAPALFFLLGGLLTAGTYGYFGSSDKSSHDPVTWADLWVQLQKELSKARAELTQNSFTQTSSSAPSPFADPSARSFSPTPAESPFSHSRFEKQLKMLTPDQVEQRLAQNERSFRVLTKEQEARKDKERQDLILGYCINQVASNNPIEDDLSRHVVRGKDGSIEKIFFGVFDGHGGWCCSQKVAQELAPTVATELEHVKDRHDVMAVMEAIENGFLKLDDRIVNETVQKVLEFPSRPLACSSLLPAISGSCALLAYVDTKEKDLYVACTGDSRAVLGVCEPSATDKGGHSWKAVPLSFDQTGRNRWEVRRLQEEHPGEESTVVMRGRVLGGLEPTRAFGDARYKWSKEVQERVFQLFPTYRQPHRNYFTPPYVTAKPVVKHHKIRAEDRFLVMATDGLWDKLTSDEVIQLVGDLLDGKTGQEKMVLDRDELRSIKEKVKAIKGVVTGKKEDQNEEEEELTPANLPPKGPASQIRQFTFKDPSNASTHLARNALGGGDDDKLAATLSIPSPMSRVYRDDITITVIFFGHQDTKIALSNAQDSDGFVEIV